MTPEDASGKKAKAKPQTRKTAAKTSSAKPARATTSRPQVKAKAPAKTSFKTTKTRPGAAKTAPTKTSVKDKRSKAGYEYDVAFSFAGEDRKIVQSVNAQLQRSHITTFYDFDHQIKLVGENLFDLLSDIYENRARFCAMFISKHYVEKNWTNLERQAAQARAFSDREVYILPFRLDNTPVPGVLKTVGYLDVQGQSARDIARIIRLKVQQAHADEEEKKRPKSAAPATSSTRPVTSTAKAKSSPVPLVSAPGAFNHKGKISASGTWLMLHDEFYRATSVKSEGGLLVAEIKSHSADEEARLDALDPRRPGSYSHHQVSYAHGNRAFKVSVEALESRSVGGSTSFTLKLKQSSTSSGANMGFGPWADEGAEKAARQILLGEANQGTHHVSYAGLPHEAVFPRLWKRLQKRRIQSADVLRCARLEALYQLKSSGIVEHVSLLALGPASAGVLSVSFEGQRAAQFSGAVGATIRFSGKCPLAR